MKKPVCPTCNVAMRFIRLKESQFWGCVNYPECDNTVGAHEDGRPLGYPVTKLERQWRIKAHEEFDRIWKSKEMSRSQAYKWLTTSMKLGRDAHIGQMSVAECRKVIGLCKLRRPK